jgi:F420-non-reducing hydrogenase iron-sulfur subunit
MIHPNLVIDALTKGADGVLICGCHPGDCHYHEGNYKCLRRYYLIEKYLEQMGIDKRRIHLEWISASEGKQFAQLADKFTESIKEIGPSVIKKTVDTLT